MRILNLGCGLKTSSHPNIINLIPISLTLISSYLYEPIFTAEARTKICEGGFDPGQDMLELLRRNIQSFWSQPTLETTSRSI
jgi:hypothetical protein